MSAGIGSRCHRSQGHQGVGSITTELAKQDQITTVTTGLKGADSDRMTDQARALTDTYGVDFREAINAANTLMTQFGQTGEQAMSLIRDGMQGMIQGDGTEVAVDDSAVCSCFPRCWRHRLAVGGRHPKL